uniref:Pentatricopeptide repeat-containing protein At5g43820 n=1 Tax=Rhizophora mucronata TaxID=61149 RepID=A0A2P2IJW2_RHIMU
MVLWIRVRPCRTYLPFLHPSVSAFLFSTSEDGSQSNNSGNKCSPVMGVTNQSNIDEGRVLDALSALLPLSPKTSMPGPFGSCPPNDMAKIRAVADGFLSPEEKLRGVFLQKLRGVSAIERALTNVGVDLSLDVVGKVLNTGSLGGNSMIIFFNWAIRQPMIPKGIQSYNVLIRALGRRKFTDYIVKILDKLQMEGLSPNLETLSIMADSFVKAGQVYKATQILGNSERFGFKCDADSLNVILQCLCKRSHMAVAFWYFNSVKGLIPFNAITYNIMIGGCSKFGRVSDIESILEAMVEDGFSPDSLTYSYLLEGLGRAHRIGEAIEVFENMRNNGCPPDTTVYNAMICNFISVENFDECMKYYRCMVSENCDPDIDTYTKLISAFIKARKVADALEMFDEMLGRGIIPSAGIITSFIEFLCSFGPPHAAMMIYKSARKVRCKISQSAYKLLLMRLSQFGKCGMMFNIWHEMQESGYPSDTEVYEHVITGLCNLGQLENAVLVMEECLLRGFCPSRLIYSRLNNKLLASNKVEKAAKLFWKIRVARRRENAWRISRAKGWPF